MNKVIFLLAFSVLLLVPAFQNVFANHPDLDCPPPGILYTGDELPRLSDISSGEISFPYCLADIGIDTASTLCPPGYIPDTILVASFTGFTACTADPQQTPDPTHPDQCQGASILVNNHCFAEALSSMIGGTLLEINTIPLLLGAVGTNPIITGLVGITLAGIVGQAAWFVHRRKKKN